MDVAGQENRISIHPPRVGRDHGGARNTGNGPEFQSTLPVWGGTSCSCRRCRSCRFQSTLPVWGGTSAHHERRYQGRYFNPPSPCGEGLRELVVYSPAKYFNPPSPCGEGPPVNGIIPKRRDFNPPSPCGEGLVRDFPRRIIKGTFQSTLPVWGGTFFHAFSTA